MKAVRALFLLVVAGALALGGWRWFSRSTISSEFAADARAGGWKAVISDAYGSTQIWRPGAAPKDLAGFPELSKNVLEADASPGFSRAIGTFYDASTMDGTLRICDREVRKAVVRRQDWVGYSLTCPRLIEKGKVALYFESDGARHSVLRRLDATVASDPHAEAPRPDQTLDPDISLPVVPDAGACFDTTAEGARIAYLGTDSRIHVVEREPSSWSYRVLREWNTTPSLIGHDLLLSPDGTWVAARDDRKIARFDIASGARTEIGGDPDLLDLVSITPDGRWVIALAYREVGVSLLHGSVEVRNNLVAFRVGDGASFPLPIARNPRVLPMHWVGGADTLPAR